MKSAAFFFIAVSSSVVVSCSEPLSRDQRVARNCQSAGEGEKLFETYRARLVTAKNWNGVGWIRQVPITKWLACRHNLATHAPLDDCLDHMAYDERQGQLPFQQAITRCVAVALKKQTGS